MLRPPIEPAQYLSIRYADRLAVNDIVASVGSKGDSYDNSLAESFNGLYKWELIHRQGPWNGLEDVEFATMTYIDWFNHRRLHSRITDSAWDPRVLLTLETRMEHGYQQWCAAEAAEVPG